MSLDTVIDAIQLERLTEDAQTEFVRIEIELAITFCDIALTSDDPERTQRNIHNALRGYEAAMRFGQRGLRQGIQGPEFQRKLSVLKQRLHELGKDI